MKELQQSYSYTDARKELAEIMNQVAYQKQRIFLEKHGKKMAVILSVEDLESLERFENEMDIRLSDRALENIATEGTKPLRQVGKELGL